MHKKGVDEKESWMQRIRSYLAVSLLFLVVPGYFMILLAGAVAFLPVIGGTLLLAGICVMLTGSVPTGLVGSPS